LTTLDMRGFHSLLTFWAVFITTLQGWLEDGQRADLGSRESEARSKTAAGRTTEPDWMMVWCDAFLRVGQPCGAGGRAWATLGFRARIDTGERVWSGAERRHKALCCARPEHVLCKVWNID
jgi:hypothetical protein